MPQNKKVLDEMTLDDDLDTNQTNQQLTNQPAGRGHPIGQTNQLAMKLYQNASFMFNTREGGFFGN